MNLLIDTQLLLWAAGLPGKIPEKARGLLENPDNRLFFSAASLWEICIKKSLGRKDFQADPRLLKRGLLDNGWEELPIHGKHALAIDQLPSHHKDPFDRILMAQANEEGFVLLTTDSLLERYPAPVRVV